MTNHKPLSFWQQTWLRLKRDRLTMGALLVLGMIVFLSLNAGLINAHILEADPNDIHLIDAYAPPSSQYWLGADDLGRDQLARLLIGGRISLGIAVFGSLFTTVLGVGMGMVAAYFGTWVDDLIMWLINTLSAIPSLFLLLFISWLFGNGITPLWLVLLFALLGWPSVARLVRSQVFSLREQAYVLAARALGSSTPSIMVRHILPNVIPIVVIATARIVGTLILSESALSFLGFGIEPSTATWGNMLTNAQEFIILPYGRHLVLAPGLMITVTVLCLYIIGDGLRDAMDPRLR